MRLGRLLAASMMAPLLALAAPAIATPGPPNAPEYWFDRWQVPALWSGGARGQGVTIAEIDTGVNASLPELAGRVVTGTDLGPGGNGQIDREVSEFGHGTAMASIMVARPGLLGITGLAPDAKVLPIAVPLTGTSEAQRPGQLAAAIRYAADHHAKIINLSLGGTESAGSDPRPCGAQEQDAVYHALSKGAVVVAAVGNTGRTPDMVEDPGACRGVLSVGAVDRSGTVAAFSSREPYLTLTAPGVDLPSLGRVAGQAYSGDGTSQATALTSAALALVWSQYPRLTGSQVVARVLATLDDSPDPDRSRRPSPVYGYGLLDVSRAIRASVPADAPNPIYRAVAPFVAAADADSRTTARRSPRTMTRPGSTDRYLLGSPAPATDGALAGVGLAVGVGVAGAGLLALLVAVAARARRSGPGAGPGRESVSASGAAPPG